MDSELILDGHSDLLERHFPGMGGGSNPMAQMAAQAMQVARETMQQGMEAMQQMTSRPAGMGGVFPGMGGFSNNAKHKRDFDLVDEHVAEQGQGEVRDSSSSERLFRTWRACAQTAGDTDSIDTDDVDPDESLDTVIIKDSDNVVNNVQ
jgi:hypothetical protein